MISLWVTQDPLGPTGLRHVFHKESIKWVISQQRLGTIEITSKDDHVVFRLYYAQMEGSINGGTPIAGWFLREHPSKIRMMNRGTPISGTLQIAIWPHFCHSPSMSALRRVPCALSQVWKACHDQDSK